jgi:hypothetical protein
MAIISLLLVRGLLRFKPKDPISKSLVRGVLSASSMLGRLDLSLTDVEEHLDWAAFFEVANSTVWRVFDALESFRTENLGPLDDD